MAGYWNSPDLVFQSGATLTRGWQATLERYRRRYQAEGKEMGRLRFEELDVQPLGPDTAFVRGRWRLTMKDGSQPGGLFTLLLRRVSGDWKIVHDHTS
jgi:beta-aspartyl-peptidase (threonine type)